MPDHVTGEFDLIGQFFTGRSSSRPDVELGIGDDCAVLTVPADKQLVVTTDTMVSGVHFLATASPADIAHKLVAVNMSDLAAMGATPAWVSLALTLPESDSVWLTQFSDSLFQQLQRFGVSLIGGDTTRGPLTLTLTAHGLVTKHKTLKRSGSKPGDIIYCSGTIGDANAGLMQLLKGNQAEGLVSAVHRDFLIKRHQRPTARVAAGQRLLDIASGCIDLSDGLASDLRHILVASQCGAEIELTQLPLSEALKVAEDKGKWWQHALAGGDDYELLFTVPADKIGALNAIAAELEVPVTAVGKITAGTPAIAYFENNKPVDLQLSGWDHFNHET